MTYSGHVRNGTIQLDDEIELPDGTAVIVETVSGIEQESLHPDIIRVTGILPPDLDARTEYTNAMLKKHQ